MLFSLMNYVNISRNGGLLVIHFHFVYPSLYFKFTCEVCGKHIHVSRIMICWQTFFFLFSTWWYHLSCSLPWFRVSAMWFYSYYSVGNVLFSIGYLQIFWFWCDTCLCGERTVGFMSCSVSELLDLCLVIINFGKFLANYFFKYFFLLF